MSAFEEAAREVAASRWPVVDSWTERLKRPFLNNRREFLIGAVWGREHLAAQEPTDAEIEAARLAIHQALAPDWMAVANVLGADQAEYDSLLDSLARAALAAARAVRQEHQHVWTRKQNVTTKGTVMPAHEACRCGAAREEN